jgi:hypothetical protein
MSGQDVVISNRLPIIDLYELWSTSGESSSLINFHPMTIGVLIGVESSI